MRVVAKSEVDRKILLLVEEMGDASLFERACKAYCANCKLSETRTSIEQKYHEVPVEYILDRMIIEYTVNQERENSIIIQTN